MVGYHSTTSAAVGDLKQTEQRHKDTCHTNKAQTSVQIIVHTYGMIPNLVNNKSKSKFLVQVRKIMHALCSKGGGVDKLNHYQQWYINIYLP